jgi:O-antigen/teichoic acid export membrane protein
MTELQAQKAGSKAGPVEELPKMGWHRISGRFRWLVSKLSDNGSDRRRAGRDALNAFAIRVASAGLAYVTQVLLARWIGTFDYGIFVGVWTWVLILGGLSSLGLNIALMRFVPEYTEKDRLSLLRGLLQQSRLVTVSVSTGVAVVALGLLWLFGAHLDRHYVLPLMLGMLCLPPYTLTDMHDGLGRAKTWINIALVPPYILRPLLILVFMAIAKAAGLPLTAVMALTCAIASTWLTAVLQAIVIERRLGEDVPRGPRQYQPGTWIAAAAPIWFISAAELAMQNTDVLFLQFFLSPDAVGVYFAALKTISLIAFVGYAVGSAVSSRLSALHARDDRPALIATIHDAVNWTFWPSLAGAALLLLAGRSLLSLFGPEFQSGYPAMVILVVGLLIRASVGPAEFMLRMLGAQTQCAYVLGGTALLNVLLNLILVPAYGILGAATATSLTLISATIAFALVGRRVLNIDITIWSAALSLLRPAKDSQG